MIPGVCTSVHQTSSRSQSQQHLYASACEAAHTVLPRCSALMYRESGSRFERYGRADDHRMQRKALFSAFFPPSVLAHTQSVCEILFEVHGYAHFKVHPTLPACILTETKRGDRVFLSGATMQKQAWEEHTYTTSSLLLLHNSM